MLIFASASTRRTPAGYGDHRRLAAVLLNESHNPGRRRDGVGRSHESRTALITSQHHDARVVAVDRPGEINAYE